MSKEIQKVIEKSENNSTFCERKESKGGKGGASNIELNNMELVIIINVLYHFYNTFY